MTGIHRKLNLSNPSARLATLGLIFAASVFVAGAQTAQPPYALFQYSTLTGSGNTITATRVPVTLASGITVYMTVNMQFNVDANGVLTLSAGYPQASASPALITSNFLAGRYVGPSSIFQGKAIVNVAGPGLTDGGATEWSLSAGGGADTSTYPSSATWYVGPIANSPVAARLKSAGITSTVWSYGVAGSQYGSGYWRANTLIGVSQIGNTITFVSFTNGSDTNVPVDQITYTLAPAP